MAKASISNKILAHLKKTHSSLGVTTQKGVSWEGFYANKRTLYINQQGKIRVGYPLTSSRLMTVDEYLVLSKEAQNAQN